MRLNFTEKMEKIREGLRNLSVEGKVEEFLDYRGRKVRGVVSVWVKDKESKERVEEWLEGCDWLGKSNVHVSVWRYKSFN